MFIRKLAVIILSILFLVSCEEKTVTDSRIAMGTLVTVTLYESDAGKADDIFSYIYELDSEISRYTDGSYIDMINDSAGISPVPVPDEIYSLIESTVVMAEETEGLFNPAIGPLTALWGIGTEDARIPSDDEIASVLPLLDWRSIILDDEERSVFLKEKGMSLDLGAVGKGWAADMVQGYLESLSIEHAIVNLGGNILLVGGKEDGSGWNVGIKDPENTSSVFMRLSIEDGTVITSGGYQRYIEKDGVIYHHILDSRTGYPFTTDILSATVINPSGMLGDMLSTVLFAAGSEKAEAIASLHGVRAILKLEDGRIIDTDSTEGEIAVMEE